VEVVMAGGVFRTSDESFYNELHGSIRVVAPGARFVPLKWPPVAGAALMSLDELARHDRIEVPGADVAARLRAALGSWDRS